MEVICVQSDFNDPLLWMTVILYAVPSEVRSLGWQERDQDRDVGLQRTSERRSVLPLKVTVSQSNANSLGGWWSKADCSSVWVTQANVTRAMGMGKGSERWCCWNDSEALYVDRKNTLIAQAKSLTLKWGSAFFLILICFFSFYCH